MAHHLAHGNSNYGEFRDVRYTYDELNRLINVNDSKQDVFDEIFAYDAQGRIVAQRRDTSIAKNIGSEYAYYANTNRLKSVADGMGGSADERNMSDTANFVYDSEGNLVEDKSKRMKISYDWRGMPVEFKLQDEENSSDSTRLAMMYDGSGRRISKTLLTKPATATSWETVKVTHYTGIGTEVREEFHNGTRERVSVVVNMPQGLGRYKVADASQPADDNASRTFEWYLKNHLGSTMLVYGTVVSTDPNTADIGETKAAYDYRAFGEQVELLPHDLAKVTENFTGKEHDDEIALNYFGARYLDPMLGMWISVDPKRQYQNPYIYVGNNPIMGTDPDGLWGFSASVGVKGAVIAGGLINLSVNYDSERPEANKVMLTIGYGVGIDIGISKLKFKMFNKTLSKVEHVNGGPSDKDPKTGWHSQIDASLGALPIQGSFKDGETTPSSFGFGIGGGYYDTYTVDVGKFFNDKTENIRNEALEDQADINNTNLDSN